MLLILINAIVHISWVLMGGAGEQKVAAALEIQKVKTKTNIKDHILEMKQVFILLSQSKVQVLHVLSRVQVLDSSPS